MAEVTLKKKITLKRKGETADFTFSGKLKVKLFWSSPTDLDLCLFFKKKNGEVGGVFSNEYRGRKSDLGNLNEFPYMLHMGDNKEPAAGDEETEQSNVASLNEIDYLEVIADSAEHGPIYCVCSIKNKDGVNSLKKSGSDIPEVMDLGTAFEKIPGFALICNS